ncbi:MAG: MoaD family protein [Desulfatiglans sp.]|jgi:MoaD family protein|nr:MoaD family protein [Thermodesulfobacteriota bacterium]MEE4354056.1 MoaD family protein [Desulfatiglans sp.]
MNVTIRFSAPLRRFTDGRAYVELKAANVGECLRSLQDLFPSLKQELWNNEGGLNPFLGVFVNGENINSLQSLLTPLGTDDEISIIPAVAGG